MQHEEKAASLLITPINELETPFAFNPDRKTHYHNIATRSVAREEMTEDILNAKSCGEQSLVKYLNERLKDKTISFWFVLGSPC